ncbi:hypothetical protein [Providencia sneebia]|uniref:Uncharacterized protein n=1 Tax=Providencia sneebia DSM 19967 TaxID=1141660 RepID=K8WD17_9GAMM|nr:hypothetical protein [Providencia sneebia]EKT58439.1 hypothetical protein OO7_06954 [Providencia sneebia DSM 19967]
MDMTFNQFLKDFAKKYQDNFQHYTSEEKDEFFDIQKTLSIELKDAATQAFNMINSVEKLVLNNTSTALKNKEKIQDKINQFSQAIESNHPVKPSDFMTLYLRDYFNHNIIPKLDNLIKNNKNDIVVLTMHSPKPIYDNLVFIKEGNDLLFKETKLNSTLTIENFFSHKKSVHLRLNSDDQIMYKLDQRVRDVFSKNGQLGSGNKPSTSVNKLPFSTLFSNKHDNYTYSESLINHSSQFISPNLQVTLTDSNLLKTKKNTGFVIEGTNGNDIYHYHLGNGKINILDHIGNGDEITGGTDTLIIDPNISIDDIILTRLGWNNADRVNTEFDLQLDIRSADKQFSIGSIAIFMQFDKDSSIEKLVVNNQTFEWNLNLLEKSLLPYEKNNTQISLRDAINKGALIKSSNSYQPIIKDQDTNLLIQSMASLSTSRDYNFQDHQHITPYNNTMNHIMAANSRL